MKGLRSDRTTPLQMTFSEMLILVPTLTFVVETDPGGGGVLPYMGYIGMCRCEGYGLQAVYSRIGYINQSVWV